MILGLKNVFLGWVIFLFSIQTALAYWPTFSVFESEEFKPKNKSTYNIWPMIPFFPLGDFDQYGKTISQDRDQVRQMFWDELIGALGALAERGVPVEYIVDSLANILMMFDQVHDSHKAKDVINIDRSLEAQFKARLDQLFQAYDIRDHQRKIQFSAGVNSHSILPYIRALSMNRPLGKPLTPAEVDPKMGQVIADDIDFVSYGTFSNLGNGTFQLTYQITGTKNGISRSFIARGSLINALDDLARQVFDFFQKNVYPDWEPPHSGLSWVPMPANPDKAMNGGYTWEEANSYCRIRGYRLPYARELLLAESGGAYKPGGIASLSHFVPYAVADQRATTEKHVLTPGTESSTNGPIQVASNPQPKGKFWCVKGKIAQDVMVFEKIWSYIRTYRPKDPDIYRALETVRYELGDFGALETIFWGSGMSVLPRMESLDFALIYLKSRGIVISIPSKMRGVFQIGLDPILWSEMP